MKINALIVFTKYNDNNKSNTHYKLIKLNIENFL